VLCVPFVDIPAAIKAAKGSKIAIGAQNLHFEKSGAYTGEISAEMLSSLGVKYVIIGHSERRQYFSETNETVNKNTTFGP
jgi:triosephosphate isomerase